MGWLRRSSREEREIRSRLREAGRRLANARSYAEADQAARDWLDADAALTAAQGNTSAEPDTDESWAWRRDTQGGEAFQDLAGHEWLARFEQESADGENSGRDAPDRQEREPRSEAEQAAAARLREAVTHADHVRTASAAAWVAECAAPDGPVPPADAQAARLAANEAQFYADLEVMDARAALRWLRRANAAPSPWLGAASPDGRDAQAAAKTAQRKTAAEPETEGHRAWLHYLAAEEPANDAGARWFETFRERDRQAQDQHPNERQAWRRFTQGEAPQDDVEAGWFAYWEERHAFERYAQGEAPRDETDRQRFVRFEQELAAYADSGREALDPGQRPPWNEAEQATSGRVAGTPTDAEQMRVVAVDDQPDAEASGRDQHEAEPDARTPGTAGLIGQHHTHGRPVEPVARPEAEADLEAGA
jgi:hypothetical protein